METSYESFLASKVRSDRPTGFDPADIGPDDLVLSPFAGIGSEGYEAIKAGRRFIGIELKRSYFDQAVANMKNAVIASRQGSLFGAATTT